MPVIIKDLTDDEATVIMVDSNIRREELLISEKAFAYKMKYEAAGLKGIGSAKRDRSGWAGPFSPCFVGLMHQAAVTRSFSWTERPQ